MNIVCLDMEGVITPEIWIAFADSAGIPELRRTTRDEPNYDRLMHYRMDILREHGLGLADIQHVIAGIDPLPGAADFLDSLREITQFVILSDTFEEFARPLLAKLGYPTIFCNNLVTDGAGMITGYRMRTIPSKLNTVRALQTVGFTPICCGDSYNDLDMILAGKAGFLFRTTPQIRAAHPGVPAFDDYDELLEAIKAAL